MIRIALRKAHSKYLFDAAEFTGRVRVKDRARVKDRVRVTDRVSFGVWLNID